jgi:hypothetical protein
MKKFLMLALLGLALASGTSFGADEAAQKSTPKAVKVTAKTKTIAEKGRWHAVHSKKQNWTVKTAMVVAKKTSSFCAPVSRKVQLVQ